MESKSKRAAITKAAADKKAERIVTIDMRAKLSICDYFVIASGRSTTQVRAIADHIVETLKKSKHHIRPLHTEGVRGALWILLDYGDVVAHVFYHQTREFYGLERLWGDAPQRAYRPPAKREKSP